MFRTSDGTLHLRPETEADLPFLQALYASTRDAELAPLPWTPEQKTAFLQMQFDLQRRHYYQNYPDAQFALIELEGLPAGRIYIRRTPLEIGLMDIALLPEHQHKGIGGVLIRGLLEEARRKGQSVVLHVEQNNPAMQWYQRLGFAAQELQGIYQEMRWKAD